MARLPIGQDQYARTKLANHARDLQLVLVGVLDASVGNVEGLPPSGFEDAGCIIGFACAIVDGAARAHLALRQVEDGGAISAFGHLQERAAASLLNVVAVRSDGQDVGFVDVCSITASSPPPHRRAAG